MTNTQFWKLVDDYENGKLTMSELHTIVLNMNHGDTYETDADIDLITGGKKYDKK